MGVTARLVRTGKADAPFFSSLSGAEPDVLLGSGLIAGLSYAHSPKILLEALNALTGAQRSHFARGIGISLGWHLLNDPTLLDRMERSWSDSPKVVVIEKNREYEFMPGRVLNLFSADREHKNLLLFGLGAGYSQHFAHDRLTKTLLKFAADEKDYKFLEAGLRKGVSVFFIDVTDIQHRLNMTLESFTAENISKPGN